MKIKLITIACGILLSNVAMAQTLQSWMSPEVGDAWRQNYKGSGVTITVVDDFRSRSRFTGNLGYGVANMRHGEWTYNEALMIAPSATMRADDFNTAGAVALNRGLNVLNLSYGMYIAPNVAFRWGSQEQSIVNYATNGNAVISKAAGNDAVAINSVNRNGQIDALNYSLKGTKSAIFVGALSKNGTTTSQASMASYSNTAGTDTTVQKQFLVVGVEGNKTGLYGTSFAAPIVSGYAAIIGSKFTSANATQITNQLLNTARQDTIASYNASIHGRGEASLTRALAPVAIK
ncbi:MAG: S8 family serine peptidase [Burkholderiales bacterium]|jgi:subtilisin family serine protease|nr:S8 family serine peptidase [Burkholderiales bacterium]